MKPVARKDELVIQETAGEVLVYDLKTNKAICLNQTSALVWENCDGKKTALEIASEIEKQLGSSVSEDFVWLALSQLEKEKLLVNKAKLPDRFNGLSRREVIKRIGLASVIALPIVSSLIAPTAAYAQASCSGLSCTSNPGCNAQPVGCRNCNGSPGSKVCGP